MEPVDLGFELGQGAGIVDDMVGAGQSLRARGLRGEHPLSLLAIDAVTGDQPLDLDLGVDVDDNHAIGLREHAGFDQQRHDDNDVGRRSGLGDLLAGRLFDPRVEQGVETSPLFRVSEDPLPQRCTIERAAGVEHLFAEGFDEGVQTRGAGRDDLTSDQVGIDDPGAELRKAIRYRGLSRRDPAGQGDQARSVSGIEPLHDAPPRRQRKKRSAQASALSGLRAFFHSPAAYLIASP